MKVQRDQVRQRLYDHEARLLKHSGDTIFGAVHQFRAEVDQHVRDTPTETRQALEATHQEALKNRMDLGWTEHLTPVVTSALLLAGTAAGALLGPAGIHGPLIGGVAGFALSFLPAMYLGWEVGERCQGGRLHNNENRFLAFRAASQAAEQLEQQPNLPVPDLTLSEKLQRHAQAQYDQGNFMRGAEYMNAAEIYQPLGTDYLEMRHRAFYLPASQLVIDETAPDTAIPAALPLSPKAEQYDRLRVEKNEVLSEAHHRDVVRNRSGFLAGAALALGGGLAGAALGCWPVGLLLGVMAGAGRWSLEAQEGRRGIDDAYRRIDQLSAQQAQLTGP